MFPKGVFPSGNFPMVFSQMATSQMCNLPSVNFPSLFAVALGPPPPQSVLAATLGPLPYPSRRARPPLQSSVPQRSLSNLFEVAAWQIGHLGNFHLGSRPWENDFGKVPNTFHVNIKVSAMVKQ